MNIKNEQKLPVKFVFTYGWSVTQRSPHCWGECYVTLQITAAKGTTGSVNQFYFQSGVVLGFLSVHTK